MILAGSVSAAKTAKGSLENAAVFSAMAISADVIAFVAALLLLGANAGYNRSIPVNH